MREYLPYILLAVVVSATYLVKNRGVIKFPSGTGTTSSDLFAAAQALARVEAAQILDSRFADEARKAAIAVYHAPFSVPAAPDGTPPA